MYILQLKFCMTRLYSRENSGLLHFIFRLNCSMYSGGTRLSGLSCLTQRKMRHLLPRNLAGVKILPSPYTDNLAKILQNLVLIEGGVFFLCISIWRIWSRASFLLKKEEILEDIASRDSAADGTMKYRYELMNVTNQSTSFAGWDKGIWMVALHWDSLSLTRSLAVHQSGSPPPLFYSETVHL